MRPLVPLLLLALACGDFGGSAPVDPLARTVPASAKGWRQDTALTEAVAALPEAERALVATFLDDQAAREEAGLPVALVPGMKVGELPALARRTTAERVKAAFEPPSAPPATRDGEVPDGGWVKDGVIYDAAGEVQGCEGGGNWCAQAATAHPEELAELCEEVDRVRAAELAHRERAGRYVAAAATPRPAAAVDHVPVPWPSDTAFATLGFRPSSTITPFTFWVELPDPDRFVAHGLARPSPGAWAYCVATEAEPATPTPWPAASARRRAP